MKEKRQLVNPFSEDFWPTWELWKDYKWESHKFKYKGVISEQVALQQLVDLSGGDEQKAGKIIFQSIRREWQGLFPLHETTTGHGKSKAGKQQQQSTTANQGKSESERLRKEAYDELMRRNGGGEQSGDGSHLKAV